ncbi:hypothetical protein B0H13DRAFT_1894768 [Mycena leptocephala]|nr:hypothetical protein B0H13DRAFT_1894768 [Mycena leptocephala]
MPPRSPTRAAFWRLAMLLRPLTSMWPLKRDVNSALRRHHSQCTAPAVAFGPASRRPPPPISRPFTQLSLHINLLCISFNKSLLFQMNSIQNTPASGASGVGASGRHEWSLGWIGTNEPGERSRATISLDPHTQTDRRWKPSERHKSTSFAASFENRKQPPGSFISCKVAIVPMSIATQDSPVPFLGVRPKNRRVLAFTSGAYSPHPHVDPYLLSSRLVLLKPPCAACATLSSGSSGFRGWTPPPPSYRDSPCACAETHAPPCPLRGVSASSPPLGRELDLMTNAPRARQSWEQMTCWSCSLSLRAAARPRATTMLPPKLPSCAGRADCTEIRRSGDAAPEVASPAPPFLSTSSPEVHTSRQQDQHRTTALSHPHPRPRSCELSCADSAGYMCGRCGSLCGPPVVIWHVMTLDVCRAVGMGSASLRVPGVVRARVYAILHPPPPPPLSYLGYSACGALSWRRRALRLACENVRGRMQGGQWTSAYVLRADEAEEWPVHVQDNLKTGHSRGPVARRGDFWMILRGSV